MDLLECVLEQDIWNTVLDKSLDKTVSKSVLRRFSRPEAKIQLLGQIISGEYKVKPPIVKRIPKDNGGYREIYVNTDKDRILLAAINAAYYRLFENRLSPACKAYREHLSCGKTVRELSRQHIHGYKLDLSKYFDSVPRDVLNTALKELDTGSPLDRIVWEYYNTDLVVIDGETVGRYKSLAQGCAISAFLSNYVLKDVDARMSQVCEYYCRYSDDMILIAKDTDRVLQDLVEQLSAVGLSLNPDKVEKISCEQEFKFLGFGVKGSCISISQKDFESKKQEVKHVCKLVKNKKGLSQVERLRKAIFGVQNVFFSRQNPIHGWLYGKGQYINDLTRIQQLDKFCKEHIRAAVTGSWNYTTNVNRVPEQMMRDNGYVSLVHMCKLAAIDRDVFLQEHLRSVEKVQ